MIGSLFCEVEGVLANTAPLRRAALLRTLADEGLVPSNAGNFADDIADSSRDAMLRALRGQPIANDDTAVTLLALRSDRHFAMNVQAGVSLAPGAHELIERAISSCRLAIVTGLTRATVDSLLALAALDGAFEVIIAAEDVAAAKPAPDGYRKAIERMSRKRALDVRVGLALESSAIGARAARAAGIRCAVVAPFRVESIVDANAMLTSLEGETPATLDAMISLRVAG
ncbi:MAG: HAD family phosphatase [Gemmatimonadaceae bacterium]|nr:HAD family phosphatase [Gemmatimonadaceae bacterium]